MTLFNTEKFHKSIDMTFNDLKSKDPYYDPAFPKNRAKPEKTN
ncbi:hypothetical protein [Mucilaginibacter xinganensis]|uniref:Uncharacterized protein n=1 Tax=Mucilaginibacter xinganensis TaxID=1234841 RepID=A0A223NR75_9SPHI|nr:hypothetical protein [Mucilaginibacter xinganensis]ASU32250.1 hypothetical protein MuYL_0347 [Mucilaginibacter xinganensis]